MSLLFLKGAVEDFSVFRFIAFFLLCLNILLGSYSAAGPHTIVNGKDVVNFASANYLGLIGHEKLLVT